MTVVYAVGPREAVLLLGNDDAALSGSTGAWSSSQGLTRTRIRKRSLRHLQAGRNTIVVKVRDFKQAHGFSLRFGESPSEVARAYPMPANGKKPRRRSARRWHSTRKTGIGKRSPTGHKRSPRPAVERGEGGV